MKILEVTNFFKPSWEAGGPARSVYEISKKLIKNGHDVTVYTTDGFKSRLDVEKNKPIIIDGIQTYYFRNLSRFLTKRMNFPIPYYFPLVLRKKIKNFDVIHLNEHRTVLAIVVHYYAKKYGIPYILQPRGSVPTISKSKQKKLFDAIFGHSIIKDASKIIASSKIESELIQGVFSESNNEKIVHIPNGIDLGTY
ncbi:MAG: glycosyltransferase [Desulfobacula sp.]|nr:glycosyltransferase [Desulfobacula sp.]